jgi:hypothetical protein
MTSLGTFFTELNDSINKLLVGLAYTVEPKTAANNRMIYIHIFLSMCKTPPEWAVYQGGIPNSNIGVTVASFPPSGMELAPFPCGMVAGGALGHNPLHLHTLDTPCVELGLA